MCSEVQKLNERYFGCDPEIYVEIMMNFAWLCNKRNLVGVAAKGI
jgi:hypothetical protein